MFEKVNPAHPDKIADRIAGAMVDMAYAIEENPKIAVEVLIGHGSCYIIAETSVNLEIDRIREIVARIAGKGFGTVYNEFPQDSNLSKNQENGFRCGDNGIFLGMPVTKEQRILTDCAKIFYNMFKSDGKYILDGENWIICQSNNNGALKSCENMIVNPLGEWTGGCNVDTGATNRKLGSDMGDSITGGGLHGKDLSKADVSVNIYAWLKAREEKRPIEFSCAIGDETIDGIPYSEIVEIAKKYINNLGGFEKFAEWGLIR